MRKEKWLKVVLGKRHLLNIENRPLCEITQRVKIPEKKRKKIDWLYFAITVKNREIYFKDNKNSIIN